MITGKPITDMTDEELDREIETLRSVPIPSLVSRAAKPKRLDAMPRKRKSLIDFTDQGGT